MSTPHTDRLMNAGSVAGSSRDLEIANLHLAGYKAIVEQLEMLREEVHAASSHAAVTIGDLRADLAVGGSPLGEAIQMQIDNRSIDHDNLAGAIAFAFEQRRIR